MPEITECTGYKKLLAAVEHDETRFVSAYKDNSLNERALAEYRQKLGWVLERAQIYASVTGLEASAILDKWEELRSYWYMNYYQPSNQPLFGGFDSCRVFETSDELHQVVGDAGFRCPACGGVSNNPYECESGKELSKGKICDWKVYGLFGDLGKGVYVFVKEKMYGQKIFMPVAWEKTNATTK